MPTFECPICRKKLTVPRNDDAPFRPFCSHRCKMVDLGRWLDGTYTIDEPASPEDLPQTREDSEEDSD